MSFFIKICWAFLELLQTDGRTEYFWQALERRIDNDELGLQQTSLDNKRLLKAMFNILLQDAWERLLIERHVIDWEHWWLQFDSCTVNSKYLIKRRSYNYKMKSHFIVTLKITSNHVKRTCGHANGCDGLWRRVVWQKFTRIFREQYWRRQQILQKRLLAERIASRCVFVCIPCITGTSDGDVMCATLSCFTPDTTEGIWINIQ
jgi:hypothetical protein